MYGVDRMIDTWKEDIDYIVANSSQVEKIVDEGCNQWNYYDEHANLIMKKYQISKNEISYYIYKHTHDAYGNILQTIEFENNKPIYKIEYAYKAGKLLESVEYKTNICRVELDNKKVDDMELFIPVNLHYYTYCMKDRVEERVCLPSGETSYYKVYEGEKVKLLNPFHMQPQCILDSIEDGTIGVTIKEKELTSDIVNSIVKSLHDNYATCQWIIIDAFSVVNIPDEDKKISKLLKSYESNWNIRVDFG